MTLHEQSGPQALPVRQLWPVSIRDVLPMASLAAILEGPQPGYYDYRDSHQLTYGPVLGYAPEDARLVRFRDASATSFKHRNPQPIGARFLARVEEATLIYDSYLALRDRFLIADSYHNEEVSSFVFSQELPSLEVKFRFGDQDQQLRLFVHRFDNVPVVDEPCLVVTSRCAANYWHWFMEVLPRLWPVIENGLEGRYRLLLPRLTTRFQYESLRGLGIDPDRALQYSGPTGLRLRQALYPSMLTPGGYSASIPAFYRRCSRLHLPDPGRRRLFISRQGASQRRLLNETEIFEQVLRPLGFETVRSEELSFEAQARLFAQAEAVVGSHGAGLTNLLFSSPGTLCVELLSDRIFGKFYWMLASAMGHRYGCWIGNAVGDLRRGALSDFLVDAAAFKAYLIPLLEGNL